MWGRDRGIRRGGLAQLLEGLHEIDGIEWIRLLYLYPATVDDELIDAMARLPKVCKYMDMPLQHAHPEVLRAMLRPSNGERYLEILAEFRAAHSGHHDALDVHRRDSRARPKSTLRTWKSGSSARNSTASDFFEFSREEGTPSAELPRESPRPRVASGLIRLREAQRIASGRAREKRHRVDGCAYWSRSGARCPRATSFARGSDPHNAWFGRSQG
jgi:ribosomal protein S12 methylthiotransferase